MDVQNLTAHRQGGEFKDLSEAVFEERYGLFFRDLAGRVIPNMVRLQATCRKADVEVMYTTIISLTKDGRDRSLDYKITGFNVPRGSWEARVIDPLTPGDDEIHFPKSSSSVFISTHIDDVLRNLGYLVTQGTDGCLTYSPERHERSLCAIKGYCCQVTTDEPILELEQEDDG